jgi:hypothetical protein
MMNRLAIGLCVLLLGFTLIPERITAMTIKMAISPNRNE